MTAPDAGPYMNEDGDWWVPVESMGFRDARAAVIGCLHYNVPEDGTLVYKGKEMQWLDTEHEGYCGSDCPTNKKRLAWHFVENPR